ncbi:hypothetical protein NM208_g11310 [Fusarium decemcellulare]|uniref:Uncharacterized protein n=1 Tax=Fusarium decemcellulare TaxID=57161 RepID=A0ACC1RUT5_9HYPO|nr:hypothetical protein NM208_g11310 [Fusarium decemcellulare]
MIEEYGTTEVLEWMMIWDNDVTTRTHNFPCRNIRNEPRAEELLNSATLMTITSFPLLQFDYLSFIAITFATTRSHSLPTLSNSESDEHRGRQDDLDQQQGLRESTFSTTASNSDPSKRIKKESLGVFDPNHPDDTEDRGVITSSSGKTTYTDVHMCRELLQLPNRFGADCLVDYYVGMLSGNASAWLVFELDTYTRRRVLEPDIGEFCRHLTARFKRSEAALIEELCGARHTPPLAKKDITLALWAQRKAGIAKHFLFATVPWR